MLTLVSPEDAAKPVEPGTPRYWAFLSYSHHDKLIAKRLQKQLETYRVPRRLVGRATSVGPVPARVAPVFRDRDELHAGADLKASVQEALSRSRWLIVVCTPDSARSPWVNREIIEFKKLHGERRVLALIARGEPFASDMPGREAEECFPPALRRALDAEGLPTGEPLEPIAADMRKEGDGPQRAMLKLLAGMVGVSFDDLVRRDMQRRVRLLSAVAGASVLGLVAFAFLAVMAVQARNEAQHQRVQAEGLIEFMLGDLRKKLEPVGRLEVLDSVGEKALAYYGAQEASKLDATALGHRSRAMHLIGEIQSQRGNALDAQKAFEQAAATTAQLLARSPHDSARLFDHAQSVFWVGHAAWKRVDGVLAEAKLKEYLELSERLSRIDPANPDWAAEVAFAHVNLGTVQLGTDRPTAALQSLEKAGELLLALRTQRPALAFELAQNHGWRSDAYAMLGDYQSALGQEQLKLELFRAMPGGEKNATAQRGIVSSLYKSSRYELALGRPMEAEASARASLDIASRLVARDAQNRTWKGDECAARLSLAESELALGRRGPARDELAAVNACLSKFNPPGAAGQYGSHLFTARALSLSALLAFPQTSAALRQEIERFLDQAIPGLTEATRDRAKLATEVATVSLVLGDLKAADDPIGAQAAWTRAESLLRPLVAHRDGAVLTLLAHLKLRQGDAASAQTLANQIQRTNYRHSAYADLVSKLQAVRGSSATVSRPGARP
jgi:tetratricopeptide (TPR) repeat protein